MNKTLKPCPYCVPIDDSKHSVCVPSLQRHYRNIVKPTGIRKYQNQGCLHKLSSAFMHWTPVLPKTHRENKNKEEVRHPILFYFFKLVSSISKFLSSVMLPEFLYVNTYDGYSTTSLKVSSCSRLALIMWPNRHTNRFSVCFPQLWLTGLRKRGNLPHQSWSSPLHGRWVVATTEKPHLPVLVTTKPPWST